MFNIISANFRMNLLLYTKLKEQSQTKARDENAQQKQKLVKIL